jgi:Zn-dependent protease
MGWSFRLIRVAGIDLKLHATFFLILIFGAIAWGRPFGLNGALFGVLLMALLFACVALHEFGHALMAQRLGIPVREILLLPIGGVAMLSRVPRKARHELLIAAAGPAVNVLIIALLLPTLATLWAAGALRAADLVPGVGEPGLATALLWLVQANVFLALFNLIPAFPLDGGRILRAFIWMATDHARATRVAAGIGQALALAMGLFALFSFDLMLLLVATFIFLGAGAERGQSEVQSALQGLRAGDAYNRHALTLHPGERVSGAADYILTSYQPDFAVLEDGQPVGIITRAEVLQALSRDEAGRTVTAVMKPVELRIDVMLPLDEVRQLMSDHNVRVAAVFDGAEYRGLVSLEDLAKAYPLAALRRREALPQGGTA